MPPPFPHSELLDRYVRDSEQGNSTRVQVAASPALVWAALHHDRLNDCRTARALAAVRSLPARLSRSGAFGSVESVATATDVPLLESMRRDRFLPLDEVAGEEIVLGLIGQFWKLNGGTDAPVANAAEFVAFDQPGYIKIAVNFRVQATPAGCTLSTETRCRATDPAAARRFALYWALIGWGSKLIRWEILVAVRRRAETSGSD